MCDFILRNKVLFIKIFRASLKTRLIKEKTDRCGSCKETFRRRAAALRGRLTQQMSFIAVFSQKGFLEMPFIIKVTETFTVPVTFLLFLILMTLPFRLTSFWYISIIPHCLTKGEHFNSQLVDQYLFFFLYTTPNALIHQKYCWESEDENHIPFPSHISKKD